MLIPGLKKKVGNMRIKFHFYILGCFILFIFFLHFFIEEYTVSEGIKYIIFELFHNKKGIDTFILLIISIILFTCSLNIKFAYDKENGILYRQLFFIKATIKCSEISYLCYISWAGDVVIKNEAGGTLLFWPKVYHRKNFIKLFNEVRKDYPNIEIIL